MQLTVDLVDGWLARIRRAWFGVDVGEAWLCRVELVEVDQGLEV